MTKWKIGLIGLGFISETHLDSWARQTNAEVVAVCDIDPNKLEAVGKKYNIPEDSRYVSYDEMLKREDLQIIDIATKPELHLPLVKKAASAGKHILCQKPLAPTLQEAEEMVAAARAAGVCLMVSENWRWLGIYQALKRVLETEDLGKISAVRYKHHGGSTLRMNPEEKIPQPYFREMPQLLFYEMGAHWFDTWMFLFGSPSRIYAHMNRLSPFIKGEDHGIIVFSHDGFYGYQDMSWSSRENDIEHRPGTFVSLVIEAEKATVKLEASLNRDLGKIVIAYSDGRLITVEEGLSDSIATSFEPMQAHFIQCLEDAVECQTSGEKNLEVMRMVEAAYLSAKKHSPIELK